MPRRSSVFSSALTLVPSIVMSPEVIEISRLIIFMAVVLPPPDGPMSTQISPAGIVSERSSMAGRELPSYTLVTRSSTISAAVEPAFTTPQIYQRSRRGAMDGLGGRVDRAELLGVRD